NAFLAQFPSATIQRIMSDDFDAIRIFKDYAAWFCGPSPYVFELFAHPLHQAVSSAGHTILLSGFGGDQCVSSPVPLRFILPDLIKSKYFRKVWSETEQLSIISRLFLIAKCSHPLMHELMQPLHDAKLILGNVFKKSDQQKVASPHPYHRHYFKTLREAEWSFLQGPNSHEIRMRIEYSSIVAKKMGFEYRYPLLYPKLLEFFLSLPLEQKRHQGIGRYLMRRYLSSIVPEAPFNTYNKREGLNISPTMDTYKAQLQRGCYRDEFQKLSFNNFKHGKSTHKAMIKNIHAFMLSECFNSLKAAASCD
ncbi:MAG: asparagine synthase-related protein, partial [Legionella sp.]